MAPKIHRVLSLPEAASLLGISVSALTRRISDGELEAIQLPDGSMAVSEGDIAPIAADRPDFEALRGQRITISQATKKYDVNGQTIRNWIKREYITVLSSGYAMQLDEADVAYCASVYHARKHELGGSIAGARLFDEAGRPYELHYPDVAEYRRKRKQAGTSTRQGSGRRPAPLVAAGRRSQPRK